MHTLPNTTLLARSAFQLTLLGVAAIGIPTSQTANAALITSTQETVDFDDLTVSGTSRNFSSPAIEGNISFTTDNPSGEFLLIGPNNAFTTGSNFIFPDNSVTETITFTPVDDEEFLSLISVDIAELINSDPVTLTFTGTTADDTTVIEMLTTEGDQDFASVGGSPETYTFNALASGQFKSISFTNIAPGVGADNFVFSISAVPEPSAALLVGGAMAAVGLGRRRRQP